MPLPNVHIELGNGNLGQVAASTDSVAGLMITGAAVAGKLELNKPYVLSSTRDLVTLGIDPQMNPLADKEIKAFYTAAGEGSELHLIVVSQATTLTQMCAAESSSPLSKLIESAAGRIRIVGVNKIAPEAYEIDVTQGIDKDAIDAMQAAHMCATSFAERIYPLRILLAAPKWTGSTEKLFKPCEASCNRVAMVLASDDGGVSAAIGQVLGRATAIEPQQSLGRVASGAIATGGHYTDGSTIVEKASLGNLLHDAGYIFYRNYPTKNGAYLNGAPMCAPATDDYNALHLGRVIDKATVIAYSTYIGEIQGNVEIMDDGTLDVAVCKSFEGMIANAVNESMAGQISGFVAFIDPVQNITSSKTLDISCAITPKGVLDHINVLLAFRNPALKK